MFGIDFGSVGGYVKNGFDSLSGKKGMDTAAQGARDAQTQSRELADLQWQRQMQGLQEARGQTQPYLSLYDRIYGTQMAGNMSPVGGGGGGGGGLGAGSGALGPRGDGLSSVAPDGSRHPWVAGGVQAPITQGAPMPGRIAPAPTPTPTAIRPGFGGAPASMPTQAPAYRPPVPTMGSGGQSQLDQLLQRMLRGGG
jgi:hypothetical protein